MSRIKKMSFPYNQFKSAAPQFFSPSSKIIIIKALKNRNIKLNNNRFDQVNLEGTHTVIVRHITFMNI